MKKTTNRTCVRDSIVTDNDGSPMEETNGGRHSKIGRLFTGMDPDAMDRLARILYDGAISHRDPTGENWRKIPAEAHLNHALAHLNAYQRGDLTDDHLGHAFCRIMFAIATEGT